MIPRKKSLFRTVTNSSSGSKNQPATELRFTFKTKDDLAKLTEDEKIDFASKVI